MANPMMYGSKPIAIVDPTLWYMKSKQVQLIIATQGAKLLTLAAQDVFTRTLKNLSGPNYGVRTSLGGVQTPKSGPGTGKMPVPRVSGNLARSLKLVPVSVFIWSIYSDQRIANYAKYVHNGTRYMRPRRFLGDVIRQRRQIVQERMRRLLLAAVRNRGRI